MSIAEKFVSMEYGPAPEETKEALAWLDRHGRRFHHFIGGAWHAPIGGAYFDTVDPSNGETLGAVAQGSAADVDAAVQSRAGGVFWMAGAHSSCSRAIFVCHRSPRAKTFATALSTRNDGQRQADSRESRH